jgi:hypothetical protein
MPPETRLPPPKAAAAAEIACASWSDEDVATSLRRVFRRASNCSASHSRRAWRREVGSLGRRRGNQGNRGDTRTVTAEGEDTNTSFAQGGTYESLQTRKTTNTANNRHTQKSKG